VTDSVRFRVTAVATLVVVVVLAVAGGGLVVAQKRLLTERLEEGMAAAADALANDVAAGQAPDARGGFGDDDDAVQVVAADGGILAATPNVAGRGPIADPPPAGHNEVVRTRHGLPHDDAAFRVLSRRIDGPDGVVVAHLAATFDDVDDSTEALGTSLVVAVPAVAALLAVLTWWLVGRTLRPVEAATRRERRFLADAAHELRSPLARIRSELEVDLAHPEHADLLATHRSVLDEATGLQALVERLLRLARIDAGAQPRRTAPVDLDDIVLQCTRHLRAGGRVGVDTSGVSAAQVRGDRDELSGAVANLLDNAARHAASHVVLTLAEHDGHAVLTVADDGPGVPADQRERVFERFARVDDARSADAGGAGLGLAITREVVERHGGTVRIDADAATGARFVVTLPLQPSLP